MVIGNRLRELRESKTLSRGDIEKRKRNRCCWENLGFLRQYFRF